MKRSILILCSMLLMSCQSEVVDKREADMIWAKDVMSRSVVVCREGFQFLVFSFSGHNGPAFTQLFDEKGPKRCTREPATYTEKPL